MSLFLLVAGDFAETGGMDRANFALAGYLADRGDEVHLVTHRAAAELRERPNVYEHAAPKPLDSYFLGAPWLDYLGRYHARRIAARGGRVVVNGGNCIWGDVNWVHYVHASHVPQSRAHAAHALKTYLHHRRSLDREAAALRCARVIIANSERTRRDLVEKVGVDEGRARTVYLGIDSEQFRPPEAGERRQIRLCFGWRLQATKIAFIGGLGDRRKGFDTVFEAWRRLNGRPEWEADLVVMGRGAELPGWKRRVAAEGLSDQVEFLGFRDDIPRVLAACDLVVAPTRYEPYGLAVQEALAMGIPAVVTRSAGIAEHYRAELQELLLNDPENPVELAERLGHWRRNRSRFEQPLARLSAELRLHSWTRMAEQMVKCITV